MNRNFLSLALLLIFTSLQAEDPLTWTSKNGHAFEGFFVSKDADSVKLRGVEGREVDVPLAALDAPTLKQVELAHREAMKNAPIFEHENPHLRFGLYPRRDWVHLQFLQAGRPLHPEPLKLTIEASEVINNRKWNHLKLMTVESEPTVKGDQVEMRLRMDKDVIIRLYATLGREKEFTFGYELESCPENLDRVELRLSLPFSGLLSYDMQSESYKGPFSETGIKFPDLEAALKAYSIDFRGGGGKKQTVPYSRKIDSKGFSGSEVVVSHPGLPVLELSRKTATDSISLWLYGGKGPFEGYHLRFGGAAKNEEVKAGPFSISARP